MVHLNIDETHGFCMMMTFAEEADKIRLAWEMQFASEEVDAKVHAPVIEANEQNLDRLEAQFASMI